MKGKIAPDNYRAKVREMLRVTFGICGFSQDILDKFSKKLDGLYRDQIVKLIKDLSNDAILYAFRDFDDFIERQQLRMLPYTDKYQSYMVYSLRRALPPLRCLPSDPSPGLYIEPQGDFFDEKESFERCSKCLPKIIEPPLIPTFVRNRSVLERSRMMGGRDSFSNMVIRNLDNASNLDYSTVPCGLPDQYEQLLALAESRRLDGYKLLIIALTIQKSLKGNRLPYLGEAIISERGAKFRVPHIPEWHNQIIAESIGTIGFRVVSSLCPNTFRQQDYTLRTAYKNVQKFYSGDFQDATDYLHFDVIRGAWDAILDRASLSPELRENYKEAIRTLVGPHVIIKNDDIQRDIVEYRERFHDLIIGQREPPFQNPVDLPLTSSLPIMITHENEEKSDGSEVLSNDGSTIVHKVDGPTALQLNVATLDYFQTDNILGDFEATEFDLKHSKYLDTGDQVGLRVLALGAKPHEIEEGVIHAALGPDVRVEKYMVLRDPRDSDKKDEKGHYPLSVDMVPLGLGVPATLQMELRREFYNPQRGLLQHRIAPYVNKSYSRMSDSFISKISYNREWITTNRRTIDQIMELVSLPPCGSARVTKRGLHMCYGISFPALTLINYMCHSHIPRDLFIITGDDNTSAHFNDESIAKLQENHKKCGFIENQAKTLIRSSAYLHAEVFGFLDAKTNTPIMIEALHMKSLFPDRELNHYLQVPRSIWGVVKKLPKVYQYRIAAYLYQKYEYEYGILLRGGFNIFTQPMAAPVFPLPLEVYPGFTPSVFYHPDDVSMALDEVTPRIKTDAAIRYLSTLKDEKASITVPSLEGGYALPISLTEKELLGSLYSLYIDNQVRNPYPSQAPPYLPPRKILERLTGKPFTKFPEVNWNKVVITSLPGLMSGLKYIPEDQRLTPELYPTRVYIRRLWRLESFTTKPPRKLNAELVINCVCRWQRKRIDVARNVDGIWFVIWQSNSYQEADSIYESAKLWVHKSGRILLE